MPTYPYKQPLHIWSNSKQDDDLINTYGKENTKSREDTKIYVETPCGKKPRATVRRIHYEMKQYTRWEPTNKGRLQIPYESLSFSGGFGGSKPSLNSP